MPVLRWRWRRYSKNIQWCDVHAVVRQRVLPSFPTLESLGEITDAAPGRDGIYLDQAQWLSLLSLDPSVISVTCQTLKSSFCICPGRIRNGPANFCEDFRKEGYRLDRCLSFSLCKAYLKKSWLDERARSCYEQIWNCDWHQVREGQEENKVVKANKLQIPWVPWWWWWQVSHFL